MTRLRNTRSAYGAISLFLHWLMALLIVTMFILVWTRDIAPSDWRMPMIDLHKSIGITIIMLVSLRLLWRFANIRPSLPHQYPQIIHIGAKLGHWALYAFMFVMPLSGWLMVSAMGRAPSFFGFFTLPALIDKNIPLVILFKNIHEFIAYGLIAMVIAHIGAALWHYFIIKDDILTRMLPFIKLKK